MRVNTKNSFAYGLKMLIIKLRMTKPTYYFELSKVDLVDERNIQLKEEN